MNSTEVNKILAVTSRKGGESKPVIIQGRKENVPEEMGKRMLCEVTDNFLLPALAVGRS